eukprot:CAMPEP_0184694180 /NCGR_PEP_ID=MMETSP0313-20130426/2220_1 /TAXON_ID=2792 /ORGANISM="Porphyridium aerugineum, Strain SAG 1380-2" /LENGTH=548 /DNA_ID=CAMNT_0027152425 /DNA_START=150 /DNA_END=1796 /DNA_ORIENTATION=-
MDTGTSRGGISLPLLLILPTILILLQYTPTNAEIILLLTLARHGSRAPNPPVVEFCPNDKNIWNYSAPFSELTVKGMNQAYALGKHLREIYVNEYKFLPPRLEELNKNFSGFHADFWSDSATRCLQTAIAFGHGLYPDEYKNEYYPTVPLPVHSEIKQFDDLFVAPKADCKPVRLADEEEFANNVGQQIIQNNLAILKKVSQICGFDIMSLEPMERVLAWKEVADLFDFDAEQEFEPMPGLTPQLFRMTSHLSFEILMRRFYASDRQITYWAGQFPDRLMTEIRRAIKKDRMKLPVKTKYISFTSHRELIYAMILMMQWRFKLDGQPMYLNSYQLPPQTTLFWELHRQHDAYKGLDEIPKDKLSESYFVRVFIWTPNHGRVSVKTHFCKTENCTLDEFFGSIQTHIQRTGPWDEICGVNYDDPKYVRICRQLPIVPGKAKRGPGGAGEPGPPNKLSKYRWDFEMDEHEVNPLIDTAEEKFRHPWLIYSRRKKLDNQSETGDEGHPKQSSKLINVVALTLAALLGAFIAILLDRFLFRGQRRTDGYTEI